MSNKYGLIAVRVKDEIKKEFDDKAKGIDVPSASILRELVMAFIEDRLTIEKREQPIDKLFN